MIPEAQLRTDSPGPAGDDRVPVSGQPIVYEVEVPLFSRSVGGSVVVAFAATFLLASGLLAFMLATQGEWEAIPPVVGMLALITSGLFLVGLAAMAVVYRGDMRYRFTLDDEGVRSELVDTTAKTINRVAIVAGALAAKPGLMGTGMIAASGETTGVAWDGGFRPSYDAKRRTISFRNGWRTILVVYCPPDRYAEVAAFVADRMAAHGTAGRVSRSPLPRMIAITALAIGASLLLFPLVGTSEVSDLLLFLIAAFAVAMIWLISLFGYVVLAGLAAVAASVVVDALGTHESLFDGTVTNLSTFTEDDWAAFAVAGLGTAILALLSWRAIRGRLPSMLERDADSAGA